jgi:hypothetical protein
VVIGDDRVQDTGRSEMTYSTMSHTPAGSPSRMKHAINEPKNYASFTE